MMLHEKKKYRLGIDVGGTKILSVVVDEDGKVVEQLRIPTQFGPEGVVQSVLESVRKISQRLNFEPQSFRAIGLGIPGAVNHETGHVSHAVNLGIESLELGLILANEIAVPVQIENDVNVAALGAFYLHQNSSCTSLAYLNIGTGLAAGLVLGGKLWRGSRGTAGEIGHIPVDFKGERCSCGQIGCLETLVSGTALSRIWPEGQGRGINGLFEEVEKGNSQAATVVAKLVSNVAIAVRILVLTVDVDVVVIGGGLSDLGQKLLIRVQEKFESDGRESGFLTSLKLSERVFLSPPNTPLGAHGAALSTVHLPLSHA